MLHINEEAKRCLLCEDAPCTKACTTGDPARAIRAIRFDNARLASQWVVNCTDKDLEAAEKACIHYDRPIRIKELIQANKKVEPATEKTAPSLTIDFCGIHCENPFFLASSAVCTNYDMVARAFDMGWAGVFYKTICKQDIREVSPRFDAVKDNTSFAGFRNMEQLSENPHEVDFDILRRLKQNYPSKIVIASIMGAFEEEWIELAKMAEEAGCDAVELNFSCPQMRLTGMGSDVGQNAELVTFYTAFVKRNVKIPVIPKMTPNITQMNQPAMGAYFAGADAISAINTIKSVTMSAQAEVSGRQTVSGYSGRAVKPIALRFILEMAKNPIMKKIQFSGIGGIETWRDALEFIQLGCHNVQVCTAVMQYGYRIIDDLVLGLQTYMAERNIDSLEELVGEQLPNFVQPSQLDRETMVYPVIDRQKCIGCGRCYISCHDGGHQAITFDTDTRQPRIVGTKCVGCHLCRLVCPTGAIGVSKRINKKN
ncbi:NAD-dependent dihydropyrimidine dehydrogenase subunit PreA [Pseudoprevotella muciniphila]|uniref:dihydrouracil dehydrogenase (NAD(+)) n=1 Tax=Pseudoprevotella muciniphila TaxID=2133944 RepID=A0A5P8E5G4_9BACT|nr:NAD-dependent dihydropyrimidine dehydrogenase subunit PreA [Pseudoprevotella muciniphila]QFQ12164.1 NAD-dependent dihydropyrimidine dehydrogenase subunit PreA [Pseudoprevotella muciniphila]